MAEILKGTVVTGIATGGAAHAVGQDVPTTTAVTLAPLMATLLLELARWLGEEPQGAALEAAEAHYRLFMDGNARGPDGVLHYDKPPSDFMVDSRGRPVAWDPFDWRDA